MKRSIPLSLLCSSLLFLATSCVTTQYYTYNFQMEKPAPSSNLQFSNDTLYINFTFDQRFIQFELFNKLEEGIKIKWDDVSISLNGQTQRVLHFEPDLQTVARNSQPLTIPPQSKIVDRLVTTNNVTYVGSPHYQDVRIAAAYPFTDYGNPGTRESIMALQGQRITLYLPFYVKDVYCSKTFEFVVADVIARKYPDGYVDNP